MATNIFKNILQHNYGTAQPDVNILDKKTAPLARSCKYSIYPTINVWRTVEHDEQP